MKKRIVLTVMCLVFSVSLIVSCAKKSSPEDQQDCKTCKVFGNTGSVIHEEEVCNSDEEKDLRSRFPGREMMCQ